MNILSENRYFIAGIETARDFKSHTLFLPTLSIPALWDLTLKRESKALTEDEYETLEEVLKKHIATEAKMIQETKQLLRTEKDSRATTLLREIYADEARHHALMKNLLVAVITKETIFNEDTWGMLWKDVPTHGAPPEFMQP
jgi:rubrerythrin